MSEIVPERIIESLLFASSNRMTLEELEQLSELKRKDIKKALEKLEEKYSSQDTSLTIQHEEDWWKLGLKGAYLQFAEKLMPSTELPKPVVETLAMIAWKSPIVQSDLVKLRSPAVYDHIIELEKLHLITRQTKGRSYVLKVTEKFHDYFDIPEEQAQELFSTYQEPQEEENKNEFNKGDSFDETNEERDKRLIEEIKNNTIDPSAIIASDKEFLEDFDKRLESIEEQSGKVDSAIKEAEDIEEEFAHQREELGITEKNTQENANTTTENTHDAEDIEDEYDEEIAKKIKETKERLHQE